MSELWERFARPRAGWLSLGLLGVMALALAWSVQGAGWLDRMEFLVPVALWATLVGAIIGLSGVTIVIGLPLAAIIGCAVVLWAIGGEYYTELDQLGRAFALRSDAIEWTIAVLRTGYPAEMSPYAIGLACSCGSPPAWPPTRSTGTTGSSTPSCCSARGCWSTCPRPSPICSVTCSSSWPPPCCSGCVRRSWNGAMAGSAVA